MLLTMVLYQYFCDSNIRIFSDY